MKHNSTIRSVVPALLLMALAAGAAAAEYNQAIVALRLSMRENWDAQVVWTREYVNAVAAGAPPAGPVVERQLKVQDELAGLFQTYYGADTARTLAGLLKEYVRLETAYVAAVKAGDSALAVRRFALWSESGDSITDLLVRINPNWTDRGLLYLMREHLKRTTAEVTDRLKGNYAASIEDFDRIHRQAMTMSDALSAGIVKQFPAQFQ